jgi:2-succinyl-5-enolpyruvyl-6-hydroxy-3-cyclohexene-1-carboxylate synthase
LTRKDVEIIAVNPSGEWPDPGWAVSQVVPQVSLGMGDTAWMNKWVSADRSLRARMDADLVWSGQTVAAVVLNHLRDEDSLVLGASNPIRDADLAPLGSSPRIYSNRGLAGIDGTIATACGISAGSSGEVVALMGDLTALHDIGSLAQPSLEKTIDLTVVISDDHGGSLFSSLEYAAPASQIGELADYFERLFSVPMECDLTSVVRGFGLSVTEVSTPTQLSQALAVSKSGIRVIHCRLERSTRGDRDRKLASWGREAYKTRVN